MTQQNKKEKEKTYTQSCHHKSFFKLFLYCTQCVCLPLYLCRYNSYCIAMEWKHYDTMLCILSKTEEYVLKYCETFGEDCKEYFAVLTARNFKDKLMIRFLHTTVLEMVKLCNGRSVQAKL